MHADFPEVKPMFEAGRGYLDGAISIIELHGAVVACAHAAKLFSAHPALTALAQEWQNMVDRCWNEWGSSPNPLTDAAFRQWLRQQLTERAKA